MKCGSILVAFCLLLLEADNCHCSEFVSNKTWEGNCEDLWLDQGTKELKLWCYVQQPSNCSDLAPSKHHPGKDWSYVACQRRIGEKEI